MKEKTWKEKIKDALIEAVAWIMTISIFVGAGVICKMLIEYI